MPVDVFGSILVYCISPKLKILRRVTLTCLPFLISLTVCHSGFAILTTGLALRQIQTFSSESSHSVVWPVGLGSIVSGIHLLQDSLMVSSDLRFLLCSKHKSG